MKTFARIATVLILATATSGATFAASTKDSYNLALGIQLIADQTTVGSVELPVTQAVRDWFKARGVDGSRIDAPLGSLNAAYKDAIDDLVTDSDTQASLNKVVLPALRAALVRGEVEQATMRIGRHLWTLSIDGPEDNDN